MSPEPARLPLPTEAPDTIPLEAMIADVQPLAEGLWTSLAAFGRGRRQTRVLFTATEDNAGNSLLAGAAAIGLARHLRAGVTLIEANFARPGLAQFCGIRPSPGLATVLAGTASVDAAVTSLPACPELRVLPAGNPRAAVPGEFATDQARSLFRDVAESSPYVIVDAPPILEHSETRTLLDHVDGVVLVLRARGSRKADAEKALAAFEAEGIPVIGAVLNRFRPDALLK